MYIQTLRYAAEIVGGEEPLALRLKVTPSHLALWLRGKSRPPTRIFLAAVDLVTDYEVASLAKDRSTLPGRVDPTRSPP